MPTISSQPNSSLVWSSAYFLRMIFKVVANTVRYNRRLSRAGVFMLSYQHLYHAGNHADILKHWTLLECLAHLQQKPIGFDYIDTHAGAGLYSLKSLEAERTGEYLAGVGRLLSCAPDEPTLTPLMELLTPYYQRMQYPGSPEVACSQLRAQDRAWLFELHPQPLAVLRAQAKKKRVFVREADGFQGLVSQLPSPTKRALALIDPAYEIKSDYGRVVTIAQKAQTKMAQTMILIWYPLLQGPFVDYLLKQVQHTKLHNVLRLELEVSKPTAGLYGSGMLIVNPPWTLKGRAESALPALVKALSADESGGYRCEQWVGESS